MLACTARLPMAAAVTTTLRLGSYVYCNDFRHPASLAKEAAELDRLSDGRFELGIGAGWLKEEYDMLGLRFDPGQVRADRFQESVGIVRRLGCGPPHRRRLPGATGPGRAGPHPECHRLRPD
jgi:alkanesulfonate monooxygenase SsuD/methylene tetrahydromethanopterin reductase-like flavin-dependent oxidoreductase (luciferase family)